MKDIGTQKCDIPSTNYIIRFVLRYVAFALHDLIPKLVAWSFGAFIMFEP